MGINNTDTGKIRVKEHNTYEQAASASYGEASNTGGWSFPVVVFQQAKRMLLSGAFPIGFVESRLFARSAVSGTGVTEAKSSMNRPNIPAHVKSIATYLIENAGEKYIIPPLTLNVQEEVSLHTVDTETTYKAGYLVIPSGINLSITDGQHRVKGIVEAITQLAKEGNEKAAKLTRDSISVMITCEHDLKQIHQDFADCSKTKPLPASLLSLYDTRNPGNKLVFDLEKNSKLLAGRVDSTSRSLSKKSTYVFLANQIRQFVKHLLLRGNPADAQFEKRVSELIPDDAMYDAYYQKFQKFFDALTEAIPVWKEISELPLDTPKRQLIPQYRQAGWLVLTATGLNVLGCLGHDFITLDVPDWRDYVETLGSVDWTRDGELWQGNIIQDGLLKTQTSPVRQACEKLCKEIGFDPAKYRSDILANSDS